MVEKQEILEFVAARTGEGRSTSFRTLVDEFDLSPEAACSHLKRLWRERLIRSAEVPTRRRLSLGPGESIRDLTFDVSRRGRERIAWYAARDADDGWLT
jgi:hypothetical protein